eukprot:311701-Pleurochrysis_carterae.AAC.1
MHGETRCPMLVHAVKCCLRDGLVAGNKLRRGAQEPQALVTESRAQRLRDEARALNVIAPSVNDRSNVALHTVFPPLF